LPSVNDLLRAGTEQVEALVALPRSLVILNRSLANFAETVAVLDQLVRRLDRVTEPLETPLTALAPRLEALVPLLDEEVTHSLPAVLDSVERNVVPALELMGHTRSQLASIATSIERLLSIMEDGLSRMHELRGAFVVSRLRGGGRLLKPEAGTGDAASVAAEPRAEPGQGPPSGPGRVAAPASPEAARPTPRPSVAGPATEEHRSWRA
jgi:hypothetical protein